MQVSLLMGHPDVTLKPSNGEHRRRRRRSCPPIIRKLFFQDAEVMLKHFLGRDPRPDAFLMSKGLLDPDDSSSTGVFVDKSEKMFKVARGISSRLLLKK